MNKEQLKRFRLLYSRRTDRDLALHFGIPESEVKNLARRYALGKDKHTFKGIKMPRWTEEEVARLCTLFPDMGNRDIAIRLGRSEKSVTSKANKLGLRKTEEHRRRVALENINSRHAAQE